MTVATQPTAPAAQFQGIPKGEAPLVAPNGTATLVWYRFLANMWKQLGGGTIAIGSLIALKPVVDGLAAVALASGQVVAKVLSSISVGATPQVQDLSSATSPWTFLAPGPGTLVVSSGQVEIGRQGQFFICGLAGAALPLMLSDSARVTWYSHIPDVIWLPSTTTS